MLIKGSKEVTVGGQTGNSRGMVDIGRPGSRFCSCPHSRIHCTRAGVGKREVLLCLNESTGEVEIYFTDCHMIDDRKNVGERERFNCILNWSFRAQARKCLSVKVT